MQLASPETFRQQTRKQILKSIVDFESLVYERDILLMDLWPRNTMLPKPNGDAEQSIVFIDFEGVIFGRIRDDLLKYRPRLFLGQYISPLLRWKDSKADKFDEWVDWDWRPWLEVEFAHTSETITPEMREKWCD